MKEKSQTSERGPAVIVFGLDEKARPHASTFSEADRALAVKAAGLMGMATLPVTTDEHRAIAAKLPAGRVFASGKGFVPFVKAGLYNELAALAEPAGARKGTKATQPAGDPKRGSVSSPATLTADAAKGSTKGAATDANYPLPTTWADIAVGALVLVSEGEGEGYYEAVVVAEPSPDLFKCAFRDYPGYAVQVRKRQHLALLCPTAGVDGG